MPALPTVPALPPVRSIDVETPVGLARAYVYAQAPGAPGTAPTTVVLGHGAGGGVDARDLTALAARLPPLGVQVILVEQPWRTAGRRVAVAPARLDVAWRAVLSDLTVGADLGGGVVVGGRSAGARVACRTAGDVGADGVLALAFPLHPPGRPGQPGRTRADELLAVRVPLLVVKGARDGFGAAREFPPGVEVAEVFAADHGFAVPKSAGTTQAAALDALCGAVLTFLGKNFAPGLLEVV